MTLKKVHLLQNSLISVPPKKLAKRKKEDEVRPVSGLDIEALLLQGGSGRTAIEEGSVKKRPKLDLQISLDDPVKDFKRLIDDDETSFQPGIQHVAFTNGSFQEDGRGY